MTNIKSEKQNIALILKKILDRSFIIFVIFGFTTFALDYILYLQFLEKGISMNIAKASSSMIAVIFNYLLNSQFNFGGKNKITIKHSFLYSGLYVFLILIHVIINRVFFIILDNTHLAFLLAMSISVILNYISVKKFFSYYQK